MSDITQIQKETRRAEREKWILIVQGLLNAVPYKGAFTDEEVAFQDGKESAYRTVLDALNTAQEATNEA